MGHRIKCARAKWIFVCTMIAVMVFLLTLATLGNCQNEQLTLEECFDQYERGIYPHPDDCTKFLSCATADSLDCPAGLHFNPTEFVCDWPASAGCMKVTTPTPDESSTSEPDTQKSSSETDPKGATTEKPPETAPPSGETSESEKPSEVASTPSEPAAPSKASESAETDPKSSTTEEPPETAPPSGGTSESEKPSEVASTPSDPAAPSKASETAIPTTTSKYSTPSESEEPSEPSDTQPSSTPKDATSESTKDTSESSTPSESEQPSEASEPPPTPNPSTSSELETSSQSNDTTTKPSTHPENKEPSETSESKPSLTPKSTTPSELETSSQSTETTSKTSEPSQACETPSGSQEATETTPKSSTPFEPKTCSQSMESTTKSSDLTDASTSPSEPEEEATETTSKSSTPSKLETSSQPMETTTKSSVPSEASQTPSEAEDAGQSPESTQKSSPASSEATETAPQSSTPSERETFSQPMEATAKSSSPETSKAPFELEEASESPETAPNSPEPSSPTKTTQKSSSPSDPESEPSETPPALPTEPTSEPSTPSEVETSPSGATTSSGACQMPSVCGQPSEAPLTPPSEPEDVGESKCLPDAPEGASCTPPTSPQVTQSPPCGDQSQPCSQPTKAPECYSTGACGSQGKPQLERTTPKPPTLGSRFKETTMTPDNKEPLSEPPPSPPGTYNVKDCVRKHKFGIYPNINDPSKFFMCSKSGPLEMKCREGLEFDPEAFGCNRPKTTPPPPPPELNLRQCISQYKTGAFPHRTNCSRFFLCSKRGPIELVCPRGLHFNPRKLVCDWPSKYCVSPGAKTRDKIFQAMKSDKITPDVVDRCPEKLAEVAFPSGGQVDLGKELTPSQTLTPPSIYWEADHKSLYTLCMVDPDAPRTKEPNQPNQWNHWTVGNIPGNQIARGQPLVDYLPPCPAQNSPPHRYTYMVYKQPARINFNKPRVPAYSFLNRDGFSLRSFAQKYQLGNPIAGNFFKCRWDRSVPLVFQKLQMVPFQFRAGFRQGASQSSVHSYSYSFRFRQ